MAIETLDAPANTGPAARNKTVVVEQLFCALTGVPVSAEEAYWAPPLVTARELVTTIVSNLLRTPGNLGHALFTEQPNVPYTQEAREQLAARRSAEQLKLLVGLLLLVALAAVPILLLTMG
ncbi:MAG TPA: hypothetical protein VF909_19865 [Roseiflexaceae bacterium]